MILNVRCRPATESLNRAESLGRFVDKFRPYAQAPFIGPKDSLICHKTVAFVQRNAPRAGAL